MINRVIYSELFKLKLFTKKSISLVVISIFSSVFISITYFIILPAWQKVSTNIRFFKF